MAQSCTPHPSLRYPLRTETRFVSSTFCLKNSRGQICGSFLFFENAQNIPSSTGGDDLSIGSRSLERLALVNSLVEFSMEESITNSI